ncbi:MAG: xanthine phosphoribosyltransferase [Deinococcus sp.]|nr:xanthine phosphoribosyltransferase [Deinococcus sp.]
MRRLIALEGSASSSGLVRVDSFLNHQVNPQVMTAIGAEFARCFRHHSPTKVLTAEASGICPALTTAIALDVPMVYAKKHKPMQIEGPTLRRQVFSPTKGMVFDIVVSENYLKPGERILIIDDFLAGGKTVGALLEISQLAGAKVVGLGFVVEKTFSGGRAQLGNYPIESLVRIASLEGGIQFAD